MSISHGLFVLNHVRVSVTSVSLYLHGQTAVIIKGSSLESQAGTCPQYFMLRDIFCLPSPSSSMLRTLTNTSSLSSTMSLTASTLSRASCDICTRPGGQEIQILINAAKKTSLVHTPLLAPLPINIDESTETINPRDDSAVDPPDLQTCASLLAIHRDIMYCMYMPDPSWHTYYFFL